MFTAPFVVGMWAMRMTSFMSGGKAHDWNTMLRVGAPGTWEASRAGSQGAGLEVVSRDAGSSGAKERLGESGSKGAQRAIGLLMRAEGGLKARRLHLAKMVFSPENSPQPCTPTPMLAEKELGRKEWETEELRMLCLPEVPSSGTLCTWTPRGCPTMTGHGLT